jgi:threonine/homoserine/homoserine lactone efflux protein
MLLQLSIGPVCLYVFNAAARGGFLSGFFAVCAVALIDALFILAAILGIYGLLQKKNAAPVLNAFGAVVLILFGLYTILARSASTCPACASRPRQPLRLLLSMPSS